MLHFAQKALFELKKLHRKLYRNIISYLKKQIPVVRKDEKGL
jgi:hypothetical protein